MSDIINFTLTLIDPPLYVRMYDVIALSDPSWFLRNPSYLHTLAPLSKWTRPDYDKVAYDRVQYLHI